MPTRYEVDIERGVAFIFYWGDVTFDDDLTVIRMLRQDARVQPHFRTLVDCTRVTTMDCGFDRGMSLVEAYRSGWSGPRTARIALYVPQRNAVYGVLRQLEAMAGADGRLRLFTDLAEARAWVGLPPDGRGDG